MPTSFSFSLPRDDFDPIAFATGFGWTVDEAASLFDFHGRRYKLVLNESLTFEERMEFIGALTDEVSPFAESLPGRGVGEPYWAVGPYLIFDSSALSGPVAPGDTLVVTSNRRATVRRPLIGRPAGWLLSQSGVLLVPGGST